MHNLHIAENLNISLKREEFRVIFASCIKQIKVCNCPAKMKKKEKNKIVFQKQSLALDICFPIRSKEK